MNLPSAAPHQPDDPTAGSIAMCAVCGAIAGAAAGAVPIAVVVGHRIWMSRMPVEVFFTADQIGSSVWECIDGHVVAAIFVGLMGGSVTGSVLPKKYRRPHLLASAWASILGAFGVFLAMNILAESGISRYADIVLMLTLFLTLGAVYGFVLSIACKLTEMVLSRLRSPRNV